MTKLNMIEYECDCEICSAMCRSPCCGTIDEIQALIDAGYANRLMFDDWSDTSNTILIKPAMKDYEGQEAPWETRLPQGCTFWKEGKCELHNLGLKPIGGRVAYHDDENIDYKIVQNYLCEDWKESPRSEAIIKKWKELVNYNEGL